MASPGLQCETPVTSATARPFPLLAVVVQRARPPRLGGKHLGEGHLDLVVQAVDEGEADVSALSDLTSVDGLCRPDSSETVRKC